MQKLITIALSITESMSYSKAQMHMKYIDRKIVRLAGGLYGAAACHPR